MKLSFFKLFVYILIINLQFLMLIAIDVDKIFLLSNYRYMETYFKVINECQRSL